MITIPQRRVAPQTVQDAPQGALVQGAAPVINALDIVGRTVSELGKIGADIQQLDAKAKEKAAKDLADEQERADKTASTEAITIDKAAASDYLKQLKSEHTRGNAVQIEPKFNAFLKDLTEKRISQLGNDTQKSYYSEGLLPYTTAFVVESRDFTRTEVKEGQRVAAVSSKGMSRDNIVENFESPLIYSIERANIEDQNEILADINDWDPDTAKLELKKSLSEMEEARLRKWSFKDAKVAKELYTINKSLFDVKKQAELEAIFDKDDTQQFAQAAVDELELIPRDEWDAAIKKIKYTGTDSEKAKKREAVEKRAKSRGEYLDNQKAAEKKKELNTALMSLYREPDRTKRERMAYALNDPEHIDKALKASDSIEKRKKRDVETDYKVWAEVKDRIHAGEFKNTTELLEFFPSFSAADFKGLSNELDSYLTEQKSGKKADDGVIKHSTLKDAFSVALGVKYDVEDTEQMRDFRYVYDKLREKGITDFGEAKDEIRKLILDGEVFGGEKFQLWEPDMTRAEAEATGQLDKWMPDILDEDVDLGAERKSIINALSQDGITDPGDTLMRLYKKDSILKLPLSDGQKALYRRLWKQSRSKK